MVDAADLKSASCKGVWVRVPPSAVSKVVTNFPEFRGLKLISPTFLRQNPQICRPGDKETDIHLVKPENSAGFCLV